jgi:hypothetical protein
MKGWEAHLSSSSSPVSPRGSSAVSPRGATRSSDSLYDSQTSPRASLPSRSLSNSGSSLSFFPPFYLLYLFIYYI